MLCEITHAGNYVITQHTYIHPVLLSYHFTVRTWSLAKNDATKPNAIHFVSRTHPLKLKVTYPSHFVYKIIT